jgi:hypothetical protein
MKNLESFLLSILCFQVAGCVSGTIVGNGKSYEHLLNKRKTIDAVRKSLGDPVWATSYPVPTPIEDTPEYALYVKKHERNSKPFIWNGDDSRKEDKASFCEIYKRKGPYADMSRGQGYAMVGGMTLGIGDVVSLPSAIKERSEMNKKEYSLTFWYDQQRRFVGYYYGDIRDGKDQY